MKLLSGGAGGEEIKQDSDYWINKTLISNVDHCVVCDLVVHHYLAKWWSPYKKGILYILS
jgi:hypothetical protein